MYKEESLKTKNAVTVYYYKNPSIHSFNISLFLRAGSMFEQTSGISHFLEHAAIRNVNKIMDGSLYGLLDKNGMEFNASTFSEMIQFYVSGATDSFSLGAEIISKLLSPIILPTAEISAERDRIKAEIRESDDRTSLLSFTNNIVHEGTSLAKSITGTLGGVSKITQKGLEEYRKSVMSAENIFFYVTGCFSDDDIAHLASEIEKYTVEKGKMRENIAPVTEKFGKRETNVHIKNADFTMLRFSFDMDMSKIKMAEGDLLYDILLGGYNSRLFIEMSEKRGLFYDISGSSERYKNIGTFAFTFEVKNGSIYEAAETVIELLREFKEKKVEPTSMMKAGYTKNARLLYDDSRELNFTFAYDNHIMDAGYVSVEQRAEVYSAVTPDDIMRIARLIFTPENLTLTIKGNKKKIDLTRLEKIVKEL